tara:strand:+ start:2737 stop:3069 length:333 start_codon:yes stop_codon:yes gene_type:complete
MENKEEKKRIKRHIEALEKSYENLIIILNEDIEKDEETGKVKLKDAQKKVFAEGIMKASEAATSLIKMITDKKKELKELDNEETEEKQEVKVNDKRKVEEEDYPLEQHLN